MRDEMGSRFRAAVFCVALVSVTTLSGCFDLFEELWVAADGSARLKVDVAVPKVAMDLTGGDGINLFRDHAKKTDAEVKKDQAVKSFAFSDRMEGDVHHFVYELEVTDAKQLGPILARVAETLRTAGSEHMAIDFTEGERATLLFAQKLAKPSDKRVGAESWMPALLGLTHEVTGAMFEGHFVTVRLHGPAIGATNGALNEKKDTVEWKVPMRDVMAGTSPELRAEVETGAPIWVWGLFLGTPALLLLLAIAAMKRRRARPVVVG